MEKTTLLLEYLKEQYTQARQHETRQTASMTFLTAAAGVILGLAFKDGAFRPEIWWSGALVFLVGVAGWRINKAHFVGNRYHTTVAGKTRRCLEAAIDGWRSNPLSEEPSLATDKPTDIRRAALAEYGLSGPNVGIGKIIQAAVRRIPIGLMVLGIAITVITLLPPFLGAK